MTTALVTHAACLKHVTPEGHPERVARLEAVIAALDADEFASLLRVAAPMATDTALLRAHPPDHLARVAAAIPADGWRAIDGDTPVMAGSEIAARHAAGGAIAAVDLVLGGQAANAFAAVRPPGHHAEADRAMGFCLFGSVAVSALHALEARGLSRVAILDFDVHHGNGTQDVLWDEPRAAFASLHQAPFYPGSGAVAERGRYGQIANVPLPAGTDGARFRAALRDRALPALRAHAPELILVSAGFDGHRADPLAQWELDEADFADATEAVCDLADDVCGGRVVSVLEGGYDLEALAAAAAAHVRVLMARGAPGKK